VAKLAPALSPLAIKEKPPASWSFSKGPDPPPAPIFQNGAAPECHHIPSARP
jgi:hypothetical protein